jgi:hypothetical protein
MTSLARRGPHSNNSRAIEQACVNHIRDHLHCALDLSYRINFVHVHYLVEIALLALDGNNSTRGRRPPDTAPPAA